MYLNKYSNTKIYPAGWTPTRLDSFSINYKSPQAKGLVGWWPMKFPGGGKIYDVTNKGYNLISGSGANAPTWGEGLKFDLTSSQYAEVNSTPVTNYPMTMSCWVKAYDVTVNQQVMCLVSAAFNEHWFSLCVRGADSGDPGALQSNSVAGFSQANAGQVIQYKWHLLVGVFIGSNSRTVYLDTASGSDTATSSPILIDRIALGGLRRNTPVEYFSGEVRDVRLYNYALSKEEVYAMYSPETRYDLYKPTGAPIWLHTASAVVTAGDMFSMTTGF